VRVFVGDSVPERSGERVEELDSIMEGDAVLLPEEEFERVTFKVAVAESCDERL
jgi:hypothetical protein